MQECLQFKEYRTNLFFEFNFSSDNSMCIVVAFGDEIVQKFGIFRGFAFWGVVPLIEVRKKCVCAVVLA